MENLINITQLDPDVKYWFIRSDSGQHFEAFLDNDFIAIGWNAITLYDLTQVPVEQTRQKISNTYNIPLNSKSNRRAVTGIYNKLKNFIELKQGDIIFIPSQNSDQLAFGYIDSQTVTVDQENIQGCNYYKKRRVQWLTGPININSLDPTFFKIRRPRHAISEISKEYQYYIDSVLFNLYEKDNSTHFVIRVTEQNEINLVTLSKVLSDLSELMSVVQDKFGLNEDITQSTIRINLQSPGLFNIKHLGATLGLVACLIGVQGCREQQSEEVIKRINEIEAQYPELVDSSRINMANMGVKL